VPKPSKPPGCRSRPSHDVMARAVANPAVCATVIAGHDPPYPVKTDG
jgi:hypothetical protein